MKAFDNIIKRINEIQMPKSYRPMVISVMQKISETIDTFEGLEVDLEKLFEEKLFNNLKIEEYSIDREKDEYTGEGGRYDPETNTIFLLSKNSDSHFCHEFIHFLIHNLYPNQFVEDFKGSQPMPMWLDETMTQSLTNEVMKTPNATAYGPLLSLTSFIQRNVDISFSFVDFLNGKMPDIVKNNNLKQFEQDLNHFTHHYTQESGYEARSRVVSYYYNQFINQQLSNPNIKVEELISNLAQYETQTLRDGKIVPYTRETVDTCLLPEDKDQLFNAQNNFNPCLMQKLIFSKNIRVGLSQEQAEETEIFVKNYLSYVKKQLLDKHGSSEDYSQEELQSTQNLPKIKQILNSVCQSAMLKEQEQKEKQSMEAFFEDTHQVWTSEDVKQVEKNIHNLNNLSELFNSPLFLTESEKSPISGNSYFMIPIYKKSSKDTIVKNFNVSNIEELQSISKLLQHGDQSNIVIEIDGELVSVGNLAVAEDNIGLAINWKDVWQHLPEEIQTQIQSKIIEKVSVESQDKF